MTIEWSTLVRLTGAKTVANAALRWIPPFLPTLERAFGASTTQLTTILGVGEMAGMSTVAVGPALDRGRERRVMVLALTAVVASSLLALVGTTAWFAVSFTVLIVGVANYTVGGQTYISHRVPYHRRARSLGLFEVSWALALLIGAPLIALLLAVAGWRAPFVALAVAAAVAAVVVARTGTSERIGTGGTTAVDGRPTLTVRAWLVMVGSALIAMAGLSVFVISGSWLDGEFGLSTGSLGLVAMSFGAVELIASIGSAGLADRIGKLRCTLGGLLVLVVGLATMAAAGSDLAVGVGGLLVFLFGFEFAFVTSLSLVSEAVPDARGTTLAISNGVGTVARGAAAIGTGLLYSRFGIAGTIAMSASAAVAAAALLLVSRRT